MLRKTSVIIKLFSIVTYNGFSHKIQIKNKDHIILIFD